MISAEKTFFALLHLRLVYQNFFGIWISKNMLENWDNKELEFKYHF